jgi:NAD(P)-dependent dehydrogenase (short-subunit alcohol dehydrogenase family)
MQSAPELDLTAISDQRLAVSRQLGRPVCIRQGSPTAGDSVLAEAAGLLSGSFALADELPGAPFAGEVALVTGGASGIGKAIAQSLHERGAAVVNMDINPAVEGLLPGPRYLGIRIDLTDESALEAAFLRAGQAFGGLDMLVLNAGIFPPGIRIEALGLEDWRKVMSINLDPNLSMLRRAHPMLKRSPRYGRVVINASKNVLAPGAGAVAYSASKAAVTQMGRVAALEWAKDGIRVNMVHPDQVFDTGIWTPEVLQARAAHYGMSVEQYKRRNLLGVEINSRYVGEFVANMLGPMFEFITGAQIPIDGGSDRVI